MKTMIKIAAVFFAVFLALTAFSYIEKRSDRERVKQLDDALHRAVAACYASEGAYPPSLDYIVEKYGVRIDEELFDVIYRVEASNLMPEITIIEK